jgi:acyl transferase domain-containing protein/phosphopantetheinyl transferase
MEGSASMAEKGFSVNDASGRGEVAIIGMACIFPKASNLQTFWQNIVSKVDGIDDPPEDSFTNKVYDPASTANNRIYCKRGGYVKDLPPFNPADFGIMPVAMDGAEPEHFIALQVAYDALVDAGFPDKPFNRERTGVILGRGTFVNRAYISVLQHVLVVDQTIEILKELHPEHSPAELESIRARLKASLPPFSPDTAPGLPHSVMAGIIANRLDLKGPTFVLDAACASCLLALEMGMRDLLTGKCDVSVVGGVQISTPAPIQMLFTQLGAISRLPHLRPFDRKADGTMLGEGVGMIVLKRKEDAFREGHRIYAIVKGVGASSDGKGKGLLAPQVEGEELALRRAYDAAGVSPDSIGLIEAHGTALPLGDITEIEALRRVFGGRYGGPPRVALGTVKSMIGHLIPAAGIAGIIKTALALYHKILPPTLHVEEPNPQLEIEKTPFYLNTEARPWIHGSPEMPRRAGVNAFGFGGINTHAVMEEYADQADDADLYHRTWENELVLIDGATREELISRCEATLEFLAQQSGAELVDIVFTLNQRLEKKPYRLAIVAESWENLTQKLNHAIQKLKDQGRTRIKERSGIYFFENALGRQGKTAFLFPGEGSQYINMLRDLCQHFPEVRNCFDLLDRAFVNHPQNYLPSQVIFPPTKQDSSGAEAKIWEIDGAVDAVITADRALFRLLSLLGIFPQGIVGHSSGELMALEAAGAVALSSDEDLVQFIKDGNRMLRALTAAEEIPEGVLLAVGGVERQAIEAAIETASDFLVLAMDNCPHQFVLCGTETSIAEARTKLLEQGALYQVLPFTRAYHTKRFEPILKPLREFFQQATVTPPAIPLYSCMTAGPFPPEPEAIRRHGELQWARPVRFRETIEAMYAEGFRIFVEVGPRGNLVSFVNDILKGKDFLAVATNLHHRSGITQLHHALGLLAAHGVDMDLSILYKRRSPRWLDETGAAKAKHPRGVRVSRELPMLSLGKLESPTHREKVASSEAQPVPLDMRPAGGPEGVFPLPESPKPSLLPEQPWTEAAVGQGPEQKLQAASDRTTLSLRPEAQALMQEYLSTMTDFLETQEQVMLAYIQGGAGPQTGFEPLPAIPPSAPEIQAIPQSEAEPQVQAEFFPENVPPVASPAIGQYETTDAGVASFNGVLPPEQNLASRIFAIISEKTGYPVDMLNEHQNLEADLGIDSIKRVEILGTLFQQMDSLPEGAMEKLSSLRTIGEVIDGLAQYLDEAASPGPPRSAAGQPQDQEEALTKGRHHSKEAPALSLWGRVNLLIPGSEVVVTFRLDLEEDLFLRHHTLGGQVSRAEDTLLGLPMLPLSMSLEMMAAAAAQLLPGQLLAGIKDIQAHDWIVVADRFLDLETTARVNPRVPGEVKVELRVQKTDSKQPGGPQLAVEGTMVFADAYPEAPPAGVFQPGLEAPFSVSPAQFYPEALFHGPSLRCIARLLAMGSQGAEAILQVPAQAHLLNGAAHPGFLADPVLLDGAGQVVGLWAASNLEKYFVIFPTGLEEVRFYAPPRESGAPLTCRAQVALKGSGYLDSQIELVNRDGSLQARLRGLKHQRAIIPTILHHFRGSREVMLSSPWPEPLKPFNGAKAMVCCRLSQDILDFDNPEVQIWRDGVAYAVLSRRERQDWAGLARPKKRCTEWLLARIVAKEAVRRLVKERAGLEVWSADIEIRPDEHGKPQVHGEWLKELGWAPALSLTHSQGVAVALAADSADDLSVGIDLECLRPERDGFEKLAFTPEELGLTSSTGLPDSKEWALRGWCAKEAVSKALGRGLPGGPRDLIMRQLNGNSGRVLLEISGKLARELPHLTGKPLEAYTFKEGEFIFAITAINGGVS